MSQEVFSHVQHNLRLVFNLSAALS